MKKRFIALVLLLLSIPGFLAACGNDEPQPPVSPIEFVRIEWSDGYEVGEKFRGGTIVLKENGETKTITITEDMVTGFDTSKIGEFTITVTYKDFSLPIKLNVEADDLKLTLKGQTTDYFVGDAFDAKGELEIYNDGKTTKVKLTADMLEGFDTSAAGKKTVTVKYENYSIDYEINVKEHAYALTLSELTTEYYVGDSFDGKGTLVLTTDGVAGEPVAITAAMLSDFDTAAVGKKTVTITYEGHTTTYEINVKEHAYTLATNDLTAEYYVGDSFDGKGTLVLTTDGVAGDPVKITKEMLTGFDTTKAGEKTITITYEGHKTEYKINVKEHVYTLTTNDLTTEYYVGDTFDGKGTLVLTTDGESAAPVNITKEMLEGFDTSVAGEKTVTIKYEGHTTTYKINVKEHDVKLELKDVTSEYYVNDEFDGKGKLVITTDGNKEEVAITKEMITGFDTTKAGKITITIKSGDHSITKEINVKEHVYTLATNDLTTEYYVGDSFDGKGKLVITTDGKVADPVNITKEMLEGFDTTKTGEATVTITYKGQTTTYKINVKEHVYVLTASELTTEYYVGDAFDGKGKLVLTTDGKIADPVNITEEMLEGFDTSVAGEKTVTIKYEGHTTTYKINVKEHVYVLTASELTTEYYVGDEFDGKGKLVLTTDGKSADPVNITKEMLLDFDTSKAGKVIVTITYKEQTTTFEINVKEHVITGEFTNVTTEYFVGDEFDGKAKLLKTVDGNASEIQITKAMITGFDTSKAGKTTIKIQCDGFTLDVELDILTLDINSFIKMVSDAGALTGAKTREDLAPEVVLANSDILVKEFNDRFAAKPELLDNVIKLLKSAKLGDERLEALTAAINKYLPPLCNTIFDIKLAISSGMGPGQNINPMLIIKNIKKEDILNAQALIKEILKVANEQQFIDLIDALIDFFDYTKHSELLDSLMPLAELIGNQKYIEFIENSKIRFDITKENAHKAASALRNLLVALKNIDMKKVSEAIGKFNGSEEIVPQEGKTELELIAAKNLEGFKILADVFEKFNTDSKELASLSNVLEFVLAILKFKIGLANTVNFTSGFNNVYRILDLLNKYIKFIPYVLKSITEENIVDVNNMIALIVELVKLMNTGIEPMPNPDGNPDMENGSVENPQPNIPEEPMPNPGEGPDPDIPEEPNPNADRISEIYIELARYLIKYVKIINPIIKYLEENDALEEIEEVVYLIINPLLFKLKEYEISDLSNDILALIPEIIKIDEQKATDEEIGKFIGELQGKIANIKFIGVSPISESDLILQAGSTAEEFVEAYNMHYSLVDPIAKKSFALTLEMLGKSSESIEEQLKTPGIKTIYFTVNGHKLYVDLGVISDNLKVLAKDMDIDGYSIYYDVLTNQVLTIKTLFDEEKLDGFLESITFTVYDEASGLMLQLPLVGNYTKHEVITNYEGLKGVGLIKFDTDYGEFYLTGNFIKVDPKNLVITEDTENLKDGVFTVEANKHIYDETFTLSFNYGYKEHTVFGIDIRKPGFRTIEFKYNDTLYSFKLRVIEPEREDVRNINSISYANILSGRLPEVGYIEYINKNRRDIIVDYEYGELYKWAGLQIDEFNQILIDNFGKDVLDPQFKLELIEKIKEDKAIFRYSFMDGTKVIKVFEFENYLISQEDLELPFFEFETMILPEAELERVKALKGEELRAEVLKLLNKARVNLHYASGKVETITNIIDYFKANNINYRIVYDVFENIRVTVIVREEILEPDIGPEGPVDPNKKPDGKPEGPMGPDEKPEGPIGPNEKPYPGEKPEGPIGPDEKPYPDGKPEGPEEPSVPNPNRERQETHFIISKSDFNVLTNVSLSLDDRYNQNEQLVLPMPRGNLDEYVKEKIRTMGYVAVRNVYGEMFEYYTWQRALDYLLANGRLTSKIENLTLTIEYVPNDVNLNGCTYTVYLAGFNIDKDSNHILATGSNKLTADDIKSYILTGKYETPVHLVHDLYGSLLDFPELVDTLTVTESTTKENVFDVKASIDGYEIFTEIYVNYVNNPINLNIDFTFEVMHESDITDEALKNAAVVKSDYRIVYNYDLTDFFSKVHLSATLVDENSDISFYRNYIVLVRVDDKTADKDLLAAINTAQIKVLQPEISKFKIILEANDKWESEGVVQKLYPKTNAVFSVEELFYERIEWIELFDPNGRILEISYEFRDDVEEFKRCFPLVFTDLGNNLYKMTFTQGDKVFEFKFSVVENKDLK